MAKFFNEGYQKWYDEVPYHIDEADCKEKLKSQILQLIPRSSAVQNVMDHGAVDGEIAVEAIEKAISILPEGGTLLIPEGVTLLLHNYSINKSIKVDCRGRIKRPSYGESGRSSPYIILLNAPCVWDGGIIDGNREGWVNDSPGERSYPIRADYPCILKNVSSVNNLKKADGNQFSGFEMRGAPAYLENCIAEDSARTFRFMPNVTTYSENSDGLINTFKGVYYYKCEARKYSDKGFDSAGTSGYIVIDNCSGSMNMDGESFPGSWLLFENGPGHGVHTAYIKDTNFISLKSTKAVNTKYTIFNNSHFVTGDGSCFFAQRKSGEGIFDEYNVVAIDSSFSAVAMKDDGIWSITDGGKVFPLTTSSDVKWYVDNCKLTYKEAASSPLRRFHHFKNTLFNVTTTQGSSYTNIRRRSYNQHSELSPAGGHGFIFENCTFKGNPNANIIEKNTGPGPGGADTYPVGTIKIINPKGEFDTNLVPSQYRQHVQHNIDTPRVFLLQGDTVSSGTYWKAGDLILEDINNQNTGFKCIESGDAGIDAKFISISEASKYPLWKNKGYREWFGEVPRHIDSTGFRSDFVKEIQKLIPDSTVVANIMDYDVQDGKISNSAFDQAISSIPEGGTLYIPDGVTLLLNNYSIKKSIKIDCRGTLKRAGRDMKGLYSKSIVSLDAPCIWNGGFFDSNTEGYRPNNNQGICSLEINYPSIVRNIKSGSNHQGGYRNESGGIRIRSASYLEKCLVEDCAVPFFAEPLYDMYTESLDGEFKTFNGVYFYRCNARNFKKNGFASIGNIGFVMIDGCKFECSERSIMPSGELISFNDDDIGKLHTGYIKDTELIGSAYSRLCKSTDVKYTILNNSNFTSNGFISNQPDVELKKKNPVSPCLIQSTKKDANFKSCKLIALDTVFNTINLEGFLWPYKAEEKGISKIKKANFEEYENQKNNMISIHFERASFQINHRKII
jgi:hypothetical protein